MFRITPGWPSSGKRHRISQNVLFHGSNFTTNILLLRLQASNFMAAFRCFSGPRFWRPVSGLRHYTAAANSKPLIVQKYGGTSLGTSEKLDKVLSCVKKYHGDHRVFAVVSALSSHKKEEGTTTRLLKAADMAIHPNTGDFQKLVDQIADTHYSIIYTSLSSSLRDEIRQQVSEEIDRLNAFLESLSVIQELSARSHNQIIGTGERLSARLISGFLREHKIPSMYVDLSKVFQDIDSTADDFSIELRDGIGKHVMAKLVETNCAPETVPVITGYFGNVKNGLVESVGRGYSDLTAALVAAGCDADALQVWKESDGVFTGNPTKIAKARLLSHISPLEAAELTLFGNEVLHPFTMECALRDQVPIQILNTFDLESKGTTVDPKWTVDAASQPAVRAVSSKKGVTVISLSSNRQVGSRFYLAKVFDLLSRLGISVDLVSTALANVSMTVSEGITPEIEQQIKKELSKLGTVEFFKDRCIVSVIGEGMHHQRGLAARLFGCLGAAQINIEMISQGASEINMSVVVLASQQLEAISAVHKEFLEN
eukprot:g37593.t1